MKTYNAVFVVTFFKEGSCVIPGETTHKEREVKALDISLALECAKHIVAGLLMCPGTAYVELTSITLVS